MSDNDWLNPNMKLTLEERRGILEHLAYGTDWPRLLRDEKLCEVGTILEVSSVRVTIEILAWKRTKKGSWRPDYQIRDERPQLLRRVPPIHAGKKGQIDAPNAEDIEHAHIEGAYTHSVVGAVPDAGESVPLGLLNVFAVQAKERFASMQEHNAREQRADDRARQAATVVRDTALMMARRDRDPNEFLAGVQRLAIQAQAQCRGTAA